ncbi:Tetratricopeptide repeat protein 38 [Hondaea fermentalgiana]|uniref:Tetratricopeptide repeat protein 38 n=1 Tax=Hondaea fermentalgiana TaxID=2315210 RepID=A0A2R5H0E2_9STRA|nr:Tetratricopeptide repeat protein 38 [Hondaea fermentalgiana]|eukprot:GBG34221.1 Tetratricopeptide repeat protein 38 [Hondaea fermentalgiana]
MRASIAMQRVKTAGARGARALATHASTASKVTCVYGGMQLTVGGDDYAALKHAETFGDIAAAFSCGHGQPATEAEALVRSGAILCGSAEALWGLTRLFERKPWRSTRDELQEPLAALDARMHALANDPIVSEEPSEDAVCLVAATRALGDNDAVRAVQIFEDRLLTNPFNIVALRSLQEIYMRRGDTDRALACVERTLSEWLPELPSFPAVQGLHANALFACGFLGEGERIAGEALATEYNQGMAAMATAHGFLKSYRFRECVRLTRELEHVFEASLRPVSSLAGEFYYTQAIAALQCAKFRPALQHTDTLLSFPETWPQSWPQATLTLWRSLVLGGDDEWILHHDQEMPRFDLRKLFQASKDAPSSPSITDRFNIIARVPDAVQATPETARTDPSLHFHKVLVALGQGDRARAADLTAMCKDSSLLLTVCEAFLLRADGQFAQAAKALSLTQGEWSAVLGRATDAELLAIVHCECTLRAANIDVRSADPLQQNVVRPGSSEENLLALREARALMSQRTLRNPNDPCAWNFFARVLAAMGNDEVAAGASRRAKELGFQQGGYSSF